MSLWGALGTVAGAYFGGPLGAAIGGAIGGGIDQNNAIGDANAQQRDATGAAIGEQRRQFDLTRGDTQIYRDAAGRAIPQYEALVNSPTTAADAMADPGYAWSQQQGQMGIDRKFAQAGGRVSGAALKAASEWNSGNASRFYGAADQRRENRLSRLAALAQLGQSAVNTSASAGGQSAGAISNLISSQGNANAAATIGQGNVWGNAVNQIGAVGQRWAQQQAPTNPAWRGWGGTPGGDEWYG
jgi:hypothetical protein